VSGIADTAVKTFLVVVEPAGGDAAATAARVALAAEAGRLAAALGAQTRFVTRPSDPDVDPGALAAAVVQAVGTMAPTAVLVQDGDSGRQLAPLVARALGTCAVLGCSDVWPAPEGLTFVKPVYGGWLEEEVRAVDGFVPVATLDLAGLEPPEAAAAQAAAALAGAETLPVDPGAGTGAAAPRVQTLETLPPDARSVDLVHAKRIVTAGMGTADEKLMAAVHELAELLEGSVGATRPVVDEGRLPKERLIGQTGRTVAPELYVALGVSGSPHHVAGVRNADRVLSINRDVRAPIFQFSDVGYVADLQEVLPSLIDKIKAWRDAPAGGGSDVQ
jgi:electron transfer flavoprotein alpha subunit